MLDVHLEEMRKQIFVENPEGKEKNHVGKIDVDGNMIFKMYKKWHSSDELRTYLI
jgi:hypothetical protein